MLHFMSTALLRLRFKRLQNRRSKMSGLPRRQTASCRIAPLRWLVLYIKSSKLVEGDACPAHPHSHDPIINSLAAGSVERTLVTAHHTLLRRAVNASHVCIATLVDTNILISKTLITDERAPDDTGRLVGCVDIQHPVVGMQHFQVIGFALADGRIVFVAIFIAQLGEAVADGFVNKYLPERFALQTIDDRAE